MKKNAVDQAIENAKKLYKGAMNILDATAGFKTLQSGVVVPPEYEEHPTFQVMPKSKKFYDDFQMVPESLPEDVAPPKPPLDFKAIAVQLMEKKFTLTPTGDCLLSDGTHLDKKLLDSSVFISELKTATVQATVEKMQLEKKQKFGPMTAPPPPKNKVTESEKEIIKQLGMTEEQYLSLINGYKEAEVAATQGAFTKLMKPGLKEALMKEAVDIEIAKKNLEYMMGELEMAKAEPEPIVRSPLEEVKVLRTIVAAMLLSPKSLKIEDEEFVVPQDVINEVDRQFKLEFEYSHRDQTYRVRLK